MRSSFLRFASFIVMFGFIGYWLWLPLVSLPHIPKQNSIAAAFPKPTKWLAYKWRFFGRPGTFNQNIYLIATNTSLQTTDTIELVKPIVDRKQREAPFNQQANILDHFFHYYVAVIHRNVIHQRSILEMDQPGMPDSFYIHTLSTMLNNNREAMPALKAMDRYCKSVLKTQLPGYTYTEFKYIFGKHCKAGITNPFISLFAG